MKTKLVLLTALCAASTLHLGASVPGTLSATWSGSQTIPDNNASGLAFAFSLAAPEPVIITDVTVDLSLAGGWDGDLYAYLSHGSGFAVLLNRVGSTTNHPGGSGASGLNVEFSDSYLTDIHTAASNPLTGNFAPDGRFTNPFTALDTDPRTALLGSFDNLDPNGGWTLFLADVSPLGISTVQGWTVSVATTVPEPGSAALLAGAAVLLAAARARRSVKVD